MKRRAQPFVYTFLLIQKLHMPEHTHRQTGSMPAVLCGLKGFLDTFSSTHFFFFFFFTVCRNKLISAKKKRLLHVAIFWLINCAIIKLLHQQSFTCAPPEVTMLSVSGRWEVPRVSSSHLNKLMFSGESKHFDGNHAMCTDSCLQIFNFQL